MLDDLFVPDPPTGDSSNRIPNTRFVTVGIASAVASVGLPSVAGLALVGNSSTGTAVPAGLSLSGFLDVAAGSTQGNLLYRNAATWVVLPAGTNGQILQTQGASANPQWVGGKVLLNTLLPNNVASIADTTSLTSKYNSYEVTFDNVAPAANSQLQITVATSGSNFIAVTYVSEVQDFMNLALSSATATTFIRVIGSAAWTSTSYGYHGSCRISNPASTLFRKQVIGMGSCPVGASGTSTYAFSRFCGYWDGGNDAITGINFSFAATNIATGTIKIWGLL